MTSRPPLLIPFAIQRRVSVTPGQRANAKSAPFLNSAPSFEWIDIEPVEAGCKEHALIKAWVAIWRAGDWEADPINNLRVAGIAVNRE